MLNKDICSRTGCMFGAVALILVFFHFMAGPFSPQPTLEARVAGKVVAIKQAAIDGLLGREHVDTVQVQKWNTDRLLAALASLLAGVALVLAVAGFTRKETHQAVIGAALLGAGTIAFQLMLIATGVFLLLIFIILIILAVLS